MAFLQQCTYTVNTMKTSTAMLILCFAFWFVSPFIYTSTYAFILYTPISFVFCSQGLLTREVSLNYLQITDFSLLSSIHRANWIPAQLPCPMESNVSIARHDFVKL